MENNLVTSMEKIPSVLFGLDLILFAVSFFYSDKIFLISVLATNVIFLGSYLVIKKNVILFSAMMETQKIAKGLNKMLGGL